MPAQPLLATPSTAPKPHPKKKRRKKKLTAAQRAKHAAKKRAAILERLAKYSNPDHVLSPDEWCVLNGISNPTGKRILKGENGPTVTQLGRKRIGITIRHNREWHDRRARSQ
jgi:hypothetical protein